MKQFMLMVTGKGVAVPGAGSIKAEKLAAATVVQFESEDYIQAIGSAVMLKNALKLSGHGIVFPCENGLSHDHLDSFR